MDRYVVVPPMVGVRGYAWWSIVDEAPPDTASTEVARFSASLPGAGEYARVCALEMNREAGGCPIIG
jgi:hypothetical protein